MKSISILVLMVAVTTTSVHAQSVKGVLLGSVTDSTGLGVPGASVSIDHRV